MNAVRTAKEKTSGAKEQKVRNKPLAHGVGRRKASTARVYLRRGNGKIIINGRPYDGYFDTDVARLAVKGPSTVIPLLANYDVDALVCGGGLHGQAEAVRLGIARATLQADPELKSMLRQYGLLTVDSRLKERKKYGRKAARRRFQFVKR